MATSSCGNGHTSGNTGSGNRSITFSAGSAERRRATDSPTCSRKCRDGRDVRLSFATILSIIHHPGLEVVLEGEWIRIIGLIGICRISPILWSVVDEVSGIDAFLL